MKRFSKEIQRSFLALIIIAVLLLGSTPQAALAAGETTLNVAEWSATTTLANVSGRPAVIYDNGTYHMWYTITEPGDLNYTSFTDPENVPAGVPVSGDLMTGFQGSPAVIKEGDTFYMVNYTDTTERTFSMFTSTDGIAWVQGDVIFDGTGLPADIQKIDAPSLIQDTSDYKLYFQVKAADGTYAIYAATSASLNGLYTLANENNPVLIPGTSGAWDAEHIQHPMVVKDNNNYYLWYVGYPSGGTQRLGVAFSSDGITWTKSTGNPILTGRAAEPSVVKTGDTWQMWYLAESAAIKYLSATGPFEFSAIQSAVDAATAGDIIQVWPGTYVLSAALNVNKDVDLIGIDNPLIQVSGTGYKIQMTAAGATLDGFDIESTDKADQQAIIYVAASNLTIQNNRIWGTYVFGESQVSRAMVFTGGLAGVTIANNEIFDLRQPGYISGVTTGTITNNHVYRTRGWVVEQGDMTFVDNTWGSGPDANIYDIVILATVNAAYYTDVPGMSAANNDAFIEDQRTSPATLSIVYVDGSVAASGTGTQSSPLKTISEGITRVVNGGTIHVAAGTYVEDLAIDKPLTLLGPNADINPNTDSRFAEAILYPATSAPDPSVCENMAYIYVSDVTIKGFTFDGDNPALTSGIDINGADVDACEILSGYEGMGNIVVENNILRHSSYAGIDFYNYTNTSATSGNYIRYNLIEDIGETVHYNWGLGILVYNNFYADITDNVFNRVAVGVQTGNYSRANPGTTGSISHNTIEAYRRGIFHNLWYSNASSILIADNIITAGSDPNGNITKWDGIMVSSFQGAVSTDISNNAITIPDSLSLSNYRAGYVVWNTPTTATITINGGTVDGGDYGVFVNNYEGYSSNASNTSIIIRNTILRDAAIAGVYVKDSPDNTNGSTVHADILSNQILGAETGILVEGSDATAVTHWNRILNSSTSGFENTSGNLLDATNNWWGCNAGPNETGCETVGSDVTADPWLVLTLEADQAKMNAGGVINLTASLNTNSDGASILDGSVMDGIPVAFGTTYGTLSLTESTLVNAIALNTLDVPDPVTVGSATVTATIDHETVNILLDGSEMLYLPFITR
jgi:hypothetical protein